MMGKHGCAILLILCGGVYAQDRLAGSIDATRRATLPSLIHPRAQPQYDQGPIDPTRKLSQVIMGLKPSARQQAALDKLLEEQQDPASANYHRWLTPEQFGGRFGVTDRDIAYIRSWIESEGLSVDSVARGRNWIAISGTAAQFQRALRTEIHRYILNGETHFANATAPSIPAALEPVLSGFLGLNDFTTLHRSRPQFTNGDGSHYLAPGDIKTIYNIAALHN